MVQIVQKHLDGVKPFAGDIKDASLTSLHIDNDLIRLMDDDIEQDYIKQVNNKPSNKDLVRKVTTKKLTMEEATKIIKDKPKKLSKRAIIETALRQYYNI